MHMHTHKQAGTAIPLNGGAYNLLLNTTVTTNIRMNI
jgi:hypothetical protein